LIVVYSKLINVSAISWREQINFEWDRWSNPLSTRPTLIVGFLLVPDHIIMIMFAFSLMLHALLFCCFWSFYAFYNMTFCISDHLIKRVIHIWPRRDKSSYAFYPFVQRFQISFHFQVSLVWLLEFCLCFPNNQYLIVSLTYWRNIYTIA
jgi:hypothetical protein